MLCGVGLAFVAASILGYLLTRSDAREAQAALVWLSGSIASADWDGNARLAVALVVLVPAALALAPGLGMLGLGDDTASRTGSPCPARPPARTRRRHRTRRDRHRRRRAGGVRGAGLGPHRPTARRPRQPGLIPSALVGVVIVTASDLVALHLIPDVQVPVGIVTGVVGGAYLIWLLATARGGSGNR